MQFQFIYCSRNFLTVISPSLLDQIYSPIKGPLLLIVQYSLTSTFYVSLSLQCTATRLFIFNILLYHHGDLFYPCTYSACCYEYTNYRFYLNENLHIKQICHYNKTSLHTIFCEFFCQTLKCF
jgi:hypothetical protein